MIGMAYARRVLRDLGEADQDKIVRCAWQANPQGTLRTFLSLDEAYAIHNQIDPVREAFKRNPINQAGLSDLETFRLLSRISCRSQISDWQEGRPRIGAGLAYAAERLAENLSTDEVEQVLQETVQWFRRGSEQFYLREATASRMVAYLMCELHRRGALFSDRSLSAFEDWMKTCHGGKTALDYWLQSGISAKIITPLSYDAERVSTLAYTAFKREVRCLGHLVLTSVDEGDTASRRMEIRKVWIEAEKSVLEITHSNLTSIMEEVDTIIGAGPLDPIDHLRALRSVVVTASTSTKTQARSTNLSYVKEVDRIAAPFPENEAIQQERAEAWRHVTYAFSDDRTACQRHAETVDRIAAPFPEIEAIQIERAEAWSYVTYAFINDRTACQRHAETVDRIAAPFPENEAIQQERVEAWRHVTYAFNNDRTACQRHAETVDRIAAPFPEIEAIQKERVVAWRYVTYAFRDDRTACQRHAETVDRIAAPFPEIEAIQKERVVAWRYVTYAFNNDRTACQRHAETVDRIAAPFPENEAIQEQRVEAWSHVTYAFRDDRTACQRHAETVDRIAAPFPEIEAIQKQRVEAWSDVTYAFRDDRTACQRHAETVDRIAAPFPENEAIQQERAEAWRYVN